MKKIITKCMLGVMLLTCGAVTANVSGLVKPIEAYAASAVVVTNNNNLNVRSGPSESANSIGKFSKGTTVTINYKNGNWWNVTGRSTTGNQITGFASSAYLSESSTTSLPQSSVNIIYESSVDKNNKKVLAFVNAINKLPTWLSRNIESITITGDDYSITEFTGGTYNNSGRIVLCYKSPYINENSEQMNSYAIVAHEAGHVLDNSRNNSYSSNSIIKDLKDSVKQQIYTLNKNSAQNGWKNPKEVFAGAVQRYASNQSLPNNVYNYINDIANGRR